VFEANESSDDGLERNDRLLGVAIHSYDHEDLKTIDDVSPTLMSQVEEFFVSYNKQRGKKFKILGTSGPRRAITCIKNGIQAHKKKHKPDAQ
jgi:inorganic pyrophosphatase